MYCFINSNFYEPHRKRELPSVIKRVAREGLTQGCTIFF